MMRHASCAALAALVALVGVTVGTSGCQNRNQVVIPNRVLDRPLDLGLACVQTDGSVITPLAVNQCAGSVSNCFTRETPQVIGLVANSERNEVALFAKCLNGLIDMDPESPGYQFVPVGELPSSISIEDRGCRAAVANFGSCDISVLKVPALAAAAFGVPVEGAASSQVSTVIPRRGDGTPLGVRPGQLQMVPNNLTNSTSLGDPEVGFDDLTDGLCDPDQAASVYVTFPSCDLIAEVDLLSGRILQSRQLVATASGGIDVVDSGSDPICPVECPSQLTEEELAEIELADDAIDGAGVAPQVLALVTPVVRDADDLPGNLAESAIVDSALFVGGPGSDVLLEIPIEDRRFTDGSLELDLRAANGILGIRPTPAMELAFDLGTLGEIYHQFLYVIAGDGSTRVVRRNLDSGRLELGTECDTQVDPTQVTATICNDASYPGDNPPERRPFAQGPGIRAPNGAVVTDWSFQRVERDADDIPIRSPFTSDGVIGIGVTNVGRLVYVAFGQFGDGVLVPEILDPLETINAQLLPHSLWPVVDPASGDPSALPQVVDRPPTRFVSGTTTEANAPKVLAPTLRRVDYGYVGSDAITGVAGALITNADGLSSGDADGTALYTRDPVRVVTRDYREWRFGEWNLYWEGEIPGTASSSGQLFCDEPGPGGVFCYTTAADGSRLVDSGAAFCDSGVLAGDKVLLFGCTTTDDCGVGQICLREGSQGTGICVSAEAHADGNLLEACSEYIRDPCGTPLREFLISRAFQTELYLQAMDIPKTAYLASSVDEESGEVELTELEGRMICGEEQPEGGCKVNADCAEILGVDRRGDEVSFPLCIDGLCRRPCDEEGGEDCVLRRLPGPRCFGELLRYQIRARDSFIVRGPGGYSFFTQRVAVGDDGECVEDPSVSTLLTSRIRLGEDEEDTRFHGSWPIPSCPSGAIPETGTPNPCFVSEERPAVLTGNSTSRLFHGLNYLGNRVPALRYSNPMFSVVLDLSNPLALDAPVPGENLGWPAEFAEFRRSRIPRNYRETFSTTAGYTPYNEPAALGSVPLVGPVRVVNGPDRGTVYVVDASGSGGSGGLRGQVMRIFLTPNVSVDEGFQVR